MLQVNLRNIFQAATIKVDSSDNLIQGTINTLPSECIVSTSENGFKAILHGVEIVCEFSTYKRSAIGHNTITEVSSLSVRSQSKNCEHYQFTRDSEIIDILDLVKKVNQYQGEADRFPSTDEVLEALDIPENDFDIELDCKFFLCGKNLKAEYTLYSKTARVYQKVETASKNLKMVIKRFDTQKFLINCELSSDAIKKNREYQQNVDRIRSTANKVKGVIVSNVGADYATFKVNISEGDIEAFKQFLKSIGK